MNEFPISNLRAKYADKLTEGSPDKQAIAQLKTTLQALEGKALKIYYVEDHGIGPRDLADVEGLLDAISEGNYQAIFIKQTSEIYYVVNYDMGVNNGYVQVICINENRLISITYTYEAEVWELYDDTTGTYTFNLLPADTLYLHSLTKITTTYTYTITETSSGKTYTTTLDFTTYCNWINKSPLEGLNANSLKGVVSLVGRMIINTATSALDNRCVLNVSGCLQYVPGPNMVFVDAMVITPDKGFTIAQSSGGSESFTHTVTPL